MDSRSSSLFSGDAGSFSNTRGRRDAPNAIGLMFREKEKVRYRELRERGVCVDCGRVPAFRAGRCEPHWERKQESNRKSKAKKRWRDRKFVDCGVCGILVRKINGNVKYCRPCSVDRNGAWHQRRRFARRKERRSLLRLREGSSKGRIVFIAKSARRRKSVFARESTTNGRGKDYAFNVGRSRRERTLRCEECRRDRKLKEIKREMRKEK